MSASPLTEPAFSDDSLSLVQAQYEVSGTLFRTDDPVSILSALHHFTGNQFSSGQLAYGEAAPSRLHVVAEGPPAAVRPDDRRASLDDFPGGETLATRDILFVPDLAVDDQLDDAERSRLDARGIRAVLVLPVLVQSRVAGVLSFSHTSAVSLSAARLRALRNLADQLAVALDNRRLEAAQASAAQEKTINSLVAQFQAATSVEDLLRMALADLGEALGAERGAVRVGAPTTSNPADGRPIHD